MNKCVSVIVALVCLSTLSAWTGQWTYESTSGLLSHDTSGWVLFASQNGTNLTITGISQTPLSPSALPLNDPVPGYELISIGNGAFAYCSSLSSVTIPDSVIKINHEVFYDCDTLEEVFIGNGVTSIGDGAFYNCDSLGEISIGNGVTSIGDYAFAGCQSLTGLVLPAGIQSLGNGTLADCGSLTAVTFEGAYPEQVSKELYGWENNNSATISYLFTAHTASWEPQVANGPLADGNATWQGCPIRVLPDPTANLTVTLDKRGGAFTGPTSKSVRYGNPYGTLPLPTRAGCVFDGWWTGINGGGLTVDPTSVVSCTRNHTLYAKWLADITVQAAAALGTSNLVWLTGDNPQSWLADGLVSYDGAGAMRSARGLPDGGISFLRTSVVGPGILQFRWKTSSESGYDFLRYYLDGTERADAISGETGWLKVTLSIPAGEHVLTWVYEKDGSVDQDEDCGWLDHVVWPAVAESPEADFWLWQNTLFGMSWLPNHLFAAHDGFTTRLQTIPDDVAARVYRAITAIAVLAENAELRLLAEEFGLALDTELFTAICAFTGTDAPPCNAAIDRAAAQALPALDAALADLEAVPAGWNGTVEIAAEDSGFDETIYVDRADVLLAKSALYVLRAAVQFAQAYDLTADYSKTNIMEEVVAPFELPIITDPFNDSGFAAWDNIPAYLFGNDGYLDNAKLARSGTQALLLLQMADGGSINYVNAEFFGENGYHGQFRDIDVSAASENELTTCWGFNWIYVIDPECPECGGWHEEVEVEYTVLKSGGALLIARETGWEAEPFRISEATVYVESWNPLTEDHMRDWSSWTPESRTQPVPRFLADHPDFLKTVRDATKLPLAKASLRSALLTAQAADTSITGRTDEAMHFIEFAADQTNWLAEARQKLTEVLASLDAPQHIRVCHTNEEEVMTGYWDEDTWEWVVTSVETQRTEVINRTEVVHLGAVFEPLYLTRALLPRFSEDNEIVLGSFADPTYGGVLPEWTALHVETNLLGQVPVMRERAFQMDGQWFHTGGHALWSYTDDGGWGAIAQSGEVRRQGKVSWVETTVVGPGTLDFAWALTELADRESNLMLYVDGVRQAGGTIRGDSGWLPCLLEIQAGRHRVRWTYTLENDWNEDANAEASLGWLTDFAWAPDSALDCTATTPVAVPFAWLDGYPGLFSQDGDYESAALADQDCDGHATWEEYVAGTHPSDPASVFMALINESSAALEIGWTPDLTPARAYTVEGKTDLRDAIWGPTNTASRFFRVKVSMP